MGTRDWHLSRKRTRMSYNNIEQELTVRAHNAAKTPYTVSALMLYENADPYYEPGGLLDVRSAQYTAIDDISVSLEESAEHQASNYTIKLEAAGQLGFQIASFVLVRHAHYCAHIYKWADALKASF